MEQVAPQAAPLVNRSNGWRYTGRREAACIDGKGHVRRGYHPGFLIYFVQPFQEQLRTIRVRAFLFGFFFFVVPCLVLRAFLSYKSGAGSYCYYYGCRCCVPLFLLLLLVHTYLLPLSPVYLQYKHTYLSLLCRYIFCRRPHHHRCSPLYKYTKTLLIAINTSNLLYRQKKKMFFLYTLPGYLLFNRSGRRAAWK